MNEQNFNSVEQQMESDKRIAKLLGEIEDLRKLGTIDNESANLASFALTLKGDEALLANRIVSRGSDPASLELVLNGEISEPVMRAHRRGPGALTELEREKWLLLASQSLDENADNGLSVIEKIQQFDEAIHWLKTASDEQKKEAIHTTLDSILQIPYEEAEISGLRMRVYESDKGFASAYWSGEDFAAVKEGDLTFVGSKAKSLDEIGVKVDKQLSPTFGIIFGQK